MMEGKTSPLSNTCNFASIKPIMVDLPYPETRVSARNQLYANLLSNDYCGSVSEMTAITQYINNENRLFSEQCSMAKTFLGIAMAEMIHLQKLGELITLLGGNIGFTAMQQNGRQKMWTPACLNLQENAPNMIRANIEAENGAISQYRMHMKMINDECIHAVLARIILDEEYHIMILQALLK